MNELMFNIAQLAIQPTPENVPVDMSVTIGPQAQRPLHIDIPIIISGMAYGIGLTEKVKIALARGSALAGTAINNVEGPFIPSERKAAKHYIMLYDRGGRNYDPAIIRQTEYTHAWVPGITEPRRDKVSLIAGGGLFTPGNFLKALALGANAVYIGSIALFAMAHTQVLKTMPFEPPPSIVFADSKQSWRFNPKLGAKHLAYFLHSCKKEMMEGVRALGKSSVKDVDKSDPRALSVFAAETLGIPLISKSIFEIEDQRSQYTENRPN